MSDSPPIPTASLSPEQDATWNGYQRMRLRLAERLNRDLAQRTGLSEADYEILAFLADRPHTPVRAIALRCGLQWEKSRLSHQLRRMEERGLIQRLACPADNRSFEVAITDAGREKVSTAKTVYAHLVRQYVFAALTPKQVDALGEVANAILSTLMDENPHGPQGISKKQSG
ncbi:MAG: MarR family transcriptional regulator [Thermomicrobiales bacterium]